MALMHPRIANSAIKNAYFPTDTPTLERIATALDIGGGTVRVIDPCCGEGDALHFVVEHLRSCGADVRSYGVDVDENRAWQAKAQLDVAAHADIHDVRISERSMGLLFLNPPYGDLVSDQVQTGDQKLGRERHEKVFCRRTFNLLQPGGVLVLIIPSHSFDAELATLIARHFERVEIFASTEQVFNQCVLFGVKRRPGPPAAAVVSKLVAFGKGEGHDDLPLHWPHEPYSVPLPKVGDDFTFTAVRLDARQLAAELDGGLMKFSLWPRFGVLMRKTALAPRPPLRALVDWHLVMALAAGLICGEVTTADGRRMLIKGRTHKSKRCQIEHETASDGSVSETRVLTDKFVTVIRGIDLTPGPTLGTIVTIA
jgi:hypothetical protein